jgi:hypothetical protein
MRGRRSRSGRGRIVLLAAAAAVGAAVLVANTISPAGAARSLLTLVAMLVVPGAAIVTVVRLRSVTAEVAVVVAGSLAVWILGGVVMTSTRTWLPVELFQLVMAAATLVLLRQAWTSNRTAAADPARELGAGGEPPGHWWPYAVHLVLLAAAFVLWFHAVRSVHLDARDFAGLAPELSWTFWAGLLLLAVGFCVELARRGRGAVLATYVAGLVVMVHALPVLAYELPRYAWVYKHIGVTAFIAQGGQLDRGVDLYQNWPGFFAASAIFTSVSHTSLLATAGWAEVVFGFATVTALVFVFDEVAPQRRRARWLAAWLFVAFNWVGQDYFSPQAASFVLVLVVLGLILHTLPGPRLSGLPTGPLLVWWRQHQPVPAAWTSPTTWASDRGSLQVTVPVRRGTARLLANGPADVPAAPGGEALIYLLFAAVVVTHQLSPMMTIALTVALLVGGVAGRPRVTLVMGLLTALWFLLAHDYLASHSGLLSLSLDPFANSASNTNVSHESSGSALVSHAATLLSAAAWLLAAAGIRRRWRYGFLDLAPLVLAGVPILLLVGYSYGGEALYRVYLFSLIGTTLLAARAFFPGDGSSRRSPGAAAVLLLAVLGSAAGLTFVNLGRDQINRVPPGDLAVAQFFYANAPAGALLISGAPTLPLRVSPLYANYGVPGGYTDPDLLQLPTLRNRPMTPSAVTLIGDIYPRRFVDATAIYVALSSSMEAYVETYGIMPRGSMHRLDVLMGASGRFDLVYRNPTAVLYRIRA